MEVFSLALSQMLMMTVLILVGMALRKKNIVPEKTDVALSRLETFALVPALNFLNQIKKCNVNTFVENSKLILYGFVMIVIAIAIAYPLSRLFVRNSGESNALAYQRNIYKYALTFGNYGFMGNFIILGIWGEEMFFKYSMFTFVIALFCSGWGLFILIPKDRGAGFWKNLKKGLLTPPIIALVIGIICGLLNTKDYFPDFFIDALDNASKCMGPIAMILAGIVIGGYDFKSLFTNKKVYFVTLLRLIVLPALFLTVLKLIGTDDTIMTLALVTFATPLGMNTIVYPAAYGGETKTGASMTMVSNLLSVVTIPTMYYLFIELL